MVNFSFQKWCTDAASKIVFPPDRREVEQELYQHILDHYDHALTQGLSPEEAEKQTLRAMGDPKEIAPVLGRIHRPFWGILHLFTRRTVIVMLCLSFLCLGAYLLKSYVLFRTFSEPSYVRYDPFRDEAFQDTTVIASRLNSGAPFAMAVTDGYLFSLDRYALWQDSRMDSEGIFREDQKMYLQMRVISLVPWSSQTDISRWFRARDSLGNTYYAAYESGAEITPFLQSSWYHTAPCVYTHIIQFSDYLSQDAQWLELYCNRGGRNVVLRIDLTGESTP